MGAKKNSHYDSLKTKWGDRHAKSKKRVLARHPHALNWVKRTVHPKTLAAGSLSSLLFLNMPAAHPVPIHVNTVVQASTIKKDNHTISKPTLTTDSLIREVGANLPNFVQPLNADQEQKITKTLSTYFGMPVTAELNGIRLNMNYGYIGEEQLLPLFPGDTINTHFTSQEDARLYSGSGMASGRGAWGYFASSRESLTRQDILREEYYIAIPTFLASGYSQNVAGEYNFFKYRKMLVVNPDNGRALVCDIGDSGPSPYTGKQLGGSPRVMSYLQRADGTHKGPVLYFFIDDANNTVPLGPVSIVQ